MGVKFIISNICKCWQIEVNVYFLTNLDYTRGLLELQTLLVDIETDCYSETSIYSRKIVNEWPLSILELKQFKSHFPCQLSKLTFNGLTTYYFLSLHRVFRHGGTPTYGNLVIASYKDKLYERWL